MRIVVLDGAAVNPGDNPWAPLEQLGELTVYPLTRADDIVGRARHAEVAVTNKTPLDEAVFRELSNLRLVSVLASGYDNVDVEAAARFGITVCNVPGYATASVAQHVFALLLELLNLPHAHDEMVRDGRWYATGQFAAWVRSPLELAGRTMGIIGFGDIGRRVAAIAGAFGMSVLVHTRTPRRAPSADMRFVDLATLLEASDVVSLHCPLTPETRHLIDDRAIARMGSSTYLINTARGALVDAEALAQALFEGRIAGAGLDVFEREPMPPQHPLVRAPRCVLTPHMAWASLAARRRLLEETAANIAAFAAGRPRNVVTAASSASAKGRR